MVRLSGVNGEVDIQSALFDQLRDPATIPMRAFYAAGVDGVFSDDPAAAVAARN